MAYSMFLKVEGIDGDSTDAKHEDWIEVMSYSHGILCRAAQFVPEGYDNKPAQLTGTSEHHDFTITKRVDKASPMLALKCSTGANIPEVTLELCRATGDKTAFMVYKLFNCIVAAFFPTGSGKAEDPLPFEEVKFRYGQIVWTYTVTATGGRVRDEVHETMFDVGQATQLGG